MEIGLIGLGGISELHLQAINNTSMGKVTNIYDINPNKLEFFKEKYKKVKINRSIEDITEKNLDVIGVLTPQKLIIKY
jgi:predicted dehydrogenase